MDDDVLRNAVRRYNQGCVEGLQVDFNAVREFREELNLLDERGLWGSLVYSPLDNSVYVRSTNNNVHVDVALCTQDVSHRSTINLENVGRCGAMVGTREDIAFVDNVVRSLSPIVQNVASDRVVHRILRYGDVVTVELAKRAVDIRETTVFVPPLNINEEFGERGHERCPVPQKIIASWLICMAVMRSGTTDAQVMMHRQFLLSCYSSMTSVPPRMEANVNYEMMFRARNAVHQDGRLTWPVVLGLCMAENLKDGFERRIQVNISLQNNLGKYNGQYGWRNWMGLGIILLLLAALVVVLVKFSHLPTIAAVSSTLWAFSIPLINFVFMGDILPWSVLRPDDRGCPKIFSLKQAVRVLFSESSKRHFKTEGLCFTGEKYSGCNRFTYQFSYDNLCEIGFEKMCDSSGREYLKVPITGQFVRMVHSLNHIDHFELPTQPPPKVFEKLWFSGGTHPAGTDDDESNSLQFSAQKTKENVMKMLLESWKSQEVLSSISNCDSHLRSYKAWEESYKEPLPNTITLGMSRRVDPSDESDWTSLHREISMEDRRARMETTDASLLVGEASTVYHMAVSYRHDEGLRTDEQPRLTIESRRWDALGVICAKQMRLRQKSQVRVWVDQILAARLAPRGKINDNSKTLAAGRDRANVDADVGGVSWILNGLLPYAILQVAYIPSLNGVKSDTERMWIVIEHLLATTSMGGMVVPSQDQAMLKAGKALEGWCIKSPDDVPQLWKANAVSGLDMANNVYSSGIILGAGHLPLNALIKIARALLTGALESCPTYHADDYKMLKLWAAQLASKDWSVHQELMLNFCTGQLPPDMNVAFSYDDVYEIIANTQERKPPGSIVGASSSTLYNKAMILKSKDGKWDGVIEWLPGAVSFIRPEDNGTWCHLVNKDKIEKNTEWILHFQSNNDGTLDKIFAVGKLVNFFGGEAAYISVLLKGGSKPLGNGASVVFSQLGWPRSNDYEENFITSFSLYKYRLRDPLNKQKNLDRLEAFWKATVTEWTWWGQEGANLESPSDIENFGAMRGPEVRWQTSRDDSAMEEDASNDNGREGRRGRRVMGADELAVLPGGEEKDEEVGDDGGVLGGATNDGGGGGASPAANRVITVEECLKQDYPLHYACCYGASLKVIKYLVEEADGDKGKELLGRADNGGMYPLHQACRGGASIEVIKYLVEVDGDKGKEVFGKADQYRKCPLHYACEKGASFNVIKYLVEASGDMGKEVLCKADQNGKYPLDLLEGASREDVIKYLIQKNPGPLQIKDDSPFINSVKYFFGMKCQSTIWNETDEVVYVIVTDRTMETVNTNAMSANIAENTPGGSAGVTHTKKDNKGPTPPQMTPILPRDFHTFNLESQDYYLTYYTKDFASSRNVFHEVNLRMEGKNDYMINRHCLEHLVEREPRLAWEIFVLSVPVSNMDATTPPAADDDDDDDDVGQGQGGSSQRGTDSPAADDVGQGQGGADSSRGGEGQGEGDDTSGNNNNGGDDTSGNNDNGGDNTSGNNNRGWSRFKRRVKYNFGMKCKSTIWNETDEVVYVIVTDRTIGITTTTSAKVNPTIFGITPVDFNHECQHNKGPTPPQMTPIRRRHFRTFNLESQDYYLTYYTKTKLRENGKVFDFLAFHQINLKLLGKEDYKIYPIDLRITFASVKDEVMSKKAVLGLVTPNHPYHNGTGTVEDTRAAMLALRVLGGIGICGVLLLFMLLLWLWVTMGPDEKEL